MGYLHPDGAADAAEKICDGSIQRISGPASGIGYVQGFGRLRKAEHHPSGHQAPEYSGFRESNLQTGGFRHRQSFGEDGKRNHGRYERVHCAGGRQPAEIRKRSGYLFPRHGPVLADERQYASLPAASSADSDRGTAGSCCPAAAGRRSSAAPDQRLRGAEKCGMQSLRV